MIDRRETLNSLQPGRLLTTTASRAMMLRSIHMLASSDATELASVVIKCLDAYFVATDRFCSSLAKQIPFLPI